MHRDDEDAPTLPIACRLPAPDLERRVREVREGLARRVTAVRELEDGVAFRLPSTEEVRAQAEAFIAYERDCCPFAVFALRREGEEATPTPSLWLEVRGPGGTGDFFRELMPPPLTGEGQG